MKQKILTQLIVSAFAGVAAFGAHAGQIQSSSVSVAREVITTDTMTINSPTITYRFAGDVNTTVQTQKFQVQFSLPATPAAAQWGPTPTADTFEMRDPITSNVLTQGADYDVTNIGVSADGKTLWATFVVYQGGVQALYNQPQITLGVTGTTQPKVKGLYSVVGDIVTDFTNSTAAPYTTAGKCSDVKTLGVSFKHYVALLNEAVQADETNATPDEHLRGGATNNATIMNFPTNVVVQVTPATGNPKVDVASANTLFTGSATAGAAPDAWINNGLLNLGKITLVQNGTGYDSDLAHQYVLAGVAGGANANGLDAIVTATSNVGDVEVNTVTVSVYETKGVGAQVGSTFYLSTTTTCTAAIAGTTTAAITAGTALGPYTMTIPNGGVNAAFGATGTGPIYVCYDVAGTNVIPLGAFTALARVNKAAAGAGFNEQDNICNGPQYALGGGVKIDVRNYADSRENDASGWQSVIRLINNSETRTIDVYGQYIYADGTYGRWGKLTDLAPRAVLNLSSAQVDALLTQAPAHATGALNNPGTPARDTVRGAPRLRITSNTGSTLRVQNYLYNPANQNFIEASSTQGVDFEGTVDRAPTMEGQYQDQDAFKGLNGN